VSDLSNIVAISAGGYHSLALKNDGTVFTCGESTDGRLGRTSDVTAFTSFGQVTNLSNIIAIAAGQFHSIALKNDGTVFTCGSYTDGQLGRTSEVTAFTSFGQVTNLSNITSIGSGLFHSLALKNDGTIFTCGSNGYGQLGREGDELVFEIVSGLSNVKGLSNPILLPNGVVSLVSTLVPTGVVSLVKPVIIRSNICFLADTPVTTDQGDIAIAELQPSRHTIRGKRIVAITETFSTETYLVVVEKDALFPGCPSQKTVMSKEHKVFYQGKMIEAVRLVNGTTIHRIPYKEEKLYNVLLEEQGRMKVNHMIVETLDPANMIGKVFKAIREAMFPNPPTTLANIHT
jgi:hypothetical protein